MPRAVRTSVRLPIRIGTAGWSIPRQYGASFPGEGAHLERYSQVFSCAEINSTFYRSPRLSTYSRWVASTPVQFRFSVKAPKAITHQAALAPSREQLQTFLDEVGHLSGRLGPILFQLPPSQAFDEPRARTFFGLFRDLYPEGSAALEPRNLSWFSHEVDQLLAKFRIARVIADPPRAPEAAYAGNSYTGLIYYRLHGSPRVYYSSYSAAWLEKLAASISAHPAGSEIWCIFDNTASGAAAENALTLQADLTIQNAMRS